MSKFKVGDKVRIIGDCSGDSEGSGYYGSAQKGAVVKILELDPPEAMTVEDSRGEVWYWDSSALAPIIETKTKPKKFTKRWNKFQAAVHANAIEKGWWEEDREFGTLISLCHSELSEALEAMREGNPASEKIPEFSGVEEELVDVVIRIMDLAAHYGFDVAGAMVAKAEFNKTRSKRHGGKKF